MFYCPSSNLLNPIHLFCRVEFSLPDFHSLIYILLFRNFRDELPTCIPLFRILLFWWLDLHCLVPHPFLPQSISFLKITKQNAFLQSSLFVFKLVKQEQDQFYHMKMHFCACLIRFEKYYFAQQLPPLRYEGFMYCRGCSGVCGPWACLMGCWVLRLWWGYVGWCSAGELQFLLFGVFLLVSAEFGVWGGRLDTGL